MKKVATDRGEAGAELEALARLVGAPVRGRDHRHPALADPFTHVVRFNHRGHRIAWSENGSHFLIEVERPSGVVFAAGQPDLVVGARRPAGEIGGVAVFEGAAGGGAPLRAWIDAHPARVPALGIRAREQLLVAANRTTLIAEPGGLEQDMQRLDALCVMVDTLPDAVSPEPTADLPAGLEQLQPLLARWAIDDDEQRAVAIDHAPEDELAEVWQTVSPQLGAIDDALQQGDAGTGPLGSLAQAALEARQELQRRGDPS